MNGQIILVGSLAYYASEIAPTLATRWSSRSITLENSIDFALKESSHWRTPNDDSSLLDENDDDLEDDDDDNDYNGRRLPAYLHIEGRFLYKSEVCSFVCSRVGLLLCLTNWIHFCRVPRVSNENDDDLEDDDDDNYYNGRRLPAYLHIEGWCLYELGLILQSAS